MNTSRLSGMYTCAPDFCKVNSLYLTSHGNNLGIALSTFYRFIPPLDALNRGYLPSSTRVEGNIRELPISTHWRLP